MKLLNYTWTNVLIKHAPFIFSIKPSYINGIEVGISAVDLLFMPHNRNAKTKCNFLTFKTQTQNFLTSSTHLVPMVNLDLQVKHKIRKINFLHKITNVSFLIFSNTFATYKTKVVGKNYIISSIHNTELKHVHSLK